MSDLTVTEAQGVSEFTPEDAYTLEVRRAVALSKSTLVPKDFIGKPENCMIALQLADRIGADPMMILQNVHIIHGKPGMSSTFMIACCNMTKRFTPINYRETGEGDDAATVAWFRDAITGDVIEGPEVTMAMAKAEGWSTKAGSKWKTIPQLMRRYRAATFLIRTVCPEIALGFHTTDEHEDMRQVPRAERPAARAANEALIAASTSDTGNCGDMPGIDAPTDDEDYTEPERF